MADCPDIYLAQDNWNGTDARATYANPAIITASTTFTEGTASQISVKAQNRGPVVSPSPSTTVELYWAIPSTGFVPAGAIGAPTTTEIPPHATVPPPGEDGFSITNFSWTPDPGMASQHSGHYCLLARLFHASALPGGCTQQTFDSSQPTTDPRTAIKNIHVVEAGSGGGGSGGKRRPMAFAFAATNSLKRVADTRLNIRPLHPEQDRERLVALLHHDALERAIRSCCAKFIEPNGVQVAFGRERVQVPYRYLGWPRIPRKVEEAVQLDGGYRLSRTGPLSEREVEYFSQPGTKPTDVRGPLELKLTPGERLQTIAVVQPSEQEGAIHVIDVEHTTADGELIGGLTLVFVPPHNYFDDAKGA